jgi:hypothetical protein
METSTSKSSIASGIDSVASALDDKADNLPGGAKVASAAHATVDALQTTADYLRDQDLKGMLADLRGLAKRHPGAMLAAAGLLGFLLVRSMSKH